MRCEVFFFHLYLSFGGAGFLFFLSSYDIYLGYSLEAGDFFLLFPF